MSDLSFVHLDRLIAATAEKRAGVVTRDELIALGLGRRGIAWRVQRGLLRPLHRGVYLWGRESAEPFARGHAAVLACGDASLVSVHFAAARWAVRPEPDGPVDVTVIGRRVRVAGVCTHQTIALDVRDTRTLRGLRITSPARTLLDIAAELPTHDLAAALEQAQINRLVSRPSLQATLDRAPARAGAAALRALIAEHPFSRSPAERLLAQLLRAARLPRPAFNHVVEGFEVDAVWQPERVILEFDSYAFHATRAAFERDRRRDAAHTRAGYVVLRAIWHELEREPHALVARIAEALALAAARRRAA